MKKNKALITGVTGMVGSHLTDYLLESTDWDIYGMCRWRSPLDNIEHLLDRANKKDRLYFIDGDLNDYVSLQNAVETSRPDYVFHLAAESRIQPTLERPQDACVTNFVGTCNVLQASRLHGVKKVMYSSTSSGYGLKNEIPLNISSL